MRRYGFIYNPRSGHGYRWGLLHAAQQRLRSQGHEVREYLSAGDPANEATAALRAGCDVIVACGGDGTVNAVARAVYGSAATMAVLPLGTLNHFAKDLGIFGVPMAEKVLSTGVTRAIDAGFVNGKLFVNNSGIGIYPVMVLEREKVQRAGMPKWPAFLLACVKTALKLPFQRLRLEADGMRIARSTPFLFVGNNVYTNQGKSFGRRAHLDQGVLGIVTARHVGLWGLVRFFIRAITGTIEKDRDFIAFHAARLTVVRRRRFHVSTDGEVCRIKGPLEYSVAPHALRVLAPPT